MSAMDPDPARTPDLEPGGGVAPGSTPPETAQTSGLSAPEPRTRHRSPERVWPRWRSPSPWWPSSLWSLSR
nr:DUF6480 family protein [Nocardia amikacinitolerans]